MAVTRRGYMMLLTAGDEDISSALAEGAMAARLRMAIPLPSAAMPLPPSPEGEGKAEPDWGKVANQLRVAMHREPVDYAGLMFDAEMRYGESVYVPGPLARLAKTMLIGWAMLTLEAIRFFEWEERRWRG